MIPRFSRYALLMMGLVQIASCVRAQLPDNVVQTGTIQQPALAEASGLTYSRQYPGVYWSHNDSDFPAFLFALNQAGEYLGAYEVKGARLFDWEAIAMGEDGFLYLADTGADGPARTHVAVHRVAEPDMSERWGRADVKHTWYIRFDGVRPDVEAFFVFQGFGYLIGKFRDAANTVPMYRFNLADGSDSILAEFVTRIPAANEVGDAAISPDGNRMAFVTNDGVEVFFINGNPATGANAFSREIDFVNDWMEGGTFVGNGVLAVGERPEILLFDATVLGGAPVVTRAPVTQTVYAGGIVEFSVRATGMPPLTYTWRRDGEIIVGATTNTLVLTNVLLAQAGLYEVTIRNAQGEVRASATLTVRPRDLDVRITEIMAQPADNLNVDTGDWWELTNFDTKTVDLSGWRFNDGSGGLADAFAIPAGLSIAPGETIIFTEDLSAGEFRDWWGPNVTESQQIITYTGMGLSAFGDRLRIWKSDATRDDEVYLVADLGPALAGVSLNYEPAARLLVPSELGILGAFKAAAGEDVGSPGFVDAALRRYDVRITEIMPLPAVGSTQTADWWELTSFESTMVDLSGWRFNDSAGGVRGAFSIPEGTMIAPGESIVFVQDLSEAQFRAWWGEERVPEGTKIITYTGDYDFDATGDILRVWDVNRLSGSEVHLEASFGPAEPGIAFIYDPEAREFGRKSVLEQFGAFRAERGTDIASPGLINTISAKADVRITEVMSQPGDSTVVTRDWWELTSFESTRVDLSGWRFNDSTGGLTDGAFVVPDGVTIDPGESVIFVEDLTPAEFRAWWGEGKIAATTSIITYTNIGLSASGDSVVIWDSEALLDTEQVSRADFGLATPGVTFIYDPATGEFGRKSELGQLGAFTAELGPDIGSPGMLSGTNRTITLRITEVMSRPTTNDFPTADWWELTSFDSAVIDLSGWRFGDASGGLTNAVVISNGVRIAPGESIIFVEGLSEPQFRVWWGEDLPESTQVITYPGGELGLSSNGDSVILWDSETTSSGAVYTRADFGPADAGVTFVYDPGTGQFGRKSVAGVLGAFRAAAATDVGSPGLIDRAVELTPLRVTEVMSQELGADVEDWWELTSSAAAPIDLSGWAFNDSAGGVTDAFVIPNGVSIAPGESIIFVERLTESEFRAWWGSGKVPAGTQVITYPTTGLGFSAEGDSIMLFSNTNATEPFLTATFGMATAGRSFVYDPSSQEFGALSEAGRHGAVIAENGGEIGSPGVINGTVQRVEVRVTEVMSQAFTNNPSGSDWWELTSFAAEPVDLSGWRFNDDNGDFNEGAAIVPAGTLIGPGESIVFVEELSAAGFREWWGANNVPTDTRIISYTETSIGLGAGGDALRIWDNTGELHTFLNLEQAEQGISFIYDPVAEVFGRTSQAGLFGARTALNGGEIGSPGTIDAAGNELSVAIARQGGEFTLFFPAMAGATYQLEGAEALREGSWIEMGAPLQPDQTGTASMTVEKTGSARFFRIRRN